MATISVGSGNYLRPYRNVRVQHFPEAASQSFKRGEILIRETVADKGHEVKISGADPTAGLLGVAAADASGTEGTKIPVWLFTPEAEFIIHYGSGQALDNDDVGVAYGVVKDGTNVIWRLDNTETTAKVFEVVQLLDAHADVNGRAVVRFTTATLKGQYGIN